MAVRRFLPDTVALTEQQRLALRLSAGVGGGAAVAPGAPIATTPMGAPRGAPAFRRKRLRTLLR